MTGAPFHTAFTRDRTVVLGGILVLLILSWGYTVHMVREMPLTCHTIAAPYLRRWDAADILTAVTMWSVMMTGMMLPSVAPWIMTLSGMVQRHGSQASSLTVAGEFLAGYLAVWTGYSVLAAGLQFLLHQHTLLSPAMAGTSPVFGGILLILAGLYQWTPFKYACLAHCRSPLGYFLTSWKDGRWGAMQMGFKHGLFCVGCCWVLMLLSFVAGVMNLLWMAAITVFIFIDHTTPTGSWLGKGVGLLLLAWGGWMVVGVFVELNLGW